MHHLSCSIVLYKNNIAKLKSTIASILHSTVSVHLYLVDNSPSDKLKADLYDFLNDDRVIYIFNNKNIGYGAGHNIAIRDCKNQSPFHLVLNPDVSFKENVLEELINYMKSDETIGQVMPKVFYKDGNLQKLCHLLPTPVDLIGRRFFINLKYVQRINDEYELKDFDYNKCFNIPNLSGCFMLLRRSAFEETGDFDTRYFMYMEDVDLTRRIHKKFKTMYYPYVSIIHGFEKESYHNPLLLKYHIWSAIKYFNKWGWLFDKERKRINADTLKQLQFSEEHYSAANKNSLYKI